MIKVNKEKETVPVPKYMREGEYDQHRGQKFIYEGMEFYLVKSEKSWCITEKITKKFVVSWRKTRKQAIEEFETFVDLHCEKMKTLINYTNIH